MDPVSICAISTASGVRATTVPTDVPIDSEMKHEATKSPGTMNCSGRYFKVSPTVASTDPVSLARVANAPARMNIHTIYMTWDDPACRENISMRLVSGFPLEMTTAHADAMRSATLMGIL